MAHMDKRKEIAHIQNKCKTTRPIFRHVDLNSRLIFL
jgi:hypothetical protein